MNALNIVVGVKTDPTGFLNGSDDGTVRLWSIADDSAVACIDTKANVCSVQFSPTQSNLMAFGSANYRVYLYDLRQVCIGNGAFASITDFVCHGLLLGLQNSQVKFTYCPIACKTGIQGFAAGHFGCHHYLKSSCLPARSCLL